MQSILYLHGFHSSPFSEKAQIFKRQVAENYGEIEIIAPQLPVYPMEAIELVSELCREHRNSLIGAVGSSLGGYLATYLHNEYGLPIAVVNPAVTPFELLADYLGPQVQPITNQAYRLDAQHMVELKSIYSESIATPEKVWVLQQEGDEVLDYRQALGHYHKCRLTLEPDGCHGFEGFERYPVAIVEFLLGHDKKG